MEWGEQVNRLSIHSLSLSNNPGLPWKPLYACSLITLTPYTYSLILTETHTKTQKKGHSHTHTFWTDDPLPPFPPCIPTQCALMVSHTSTIIFDTRGAFRAILTAGTRSFLTSLMARWSLILARLCVSSTVIRTWRSSLRCSQLGFPRFISSWNAKTARFERAADGGETGFRHFFAFGWREARGHVVRLWKRRQNSRCSSAVTPVGCRYLSKCSYARYGVPKSGHSLPQLLFAFSSLGWND